MKIHILGICGTFMGSLAVLAKEMGHEVCGSDANVYPPMSTQLREQGIELMEGYSETHLSPAPDLVIVGNTLSRGNPAIEYLLNEGLRYQSGPQWLAEQVLHERHVLAVAGTHGKTTTSSMLAWILEACGREPGFLIGGIAENFGVSARLANSNLFVIEADEYDTAFFDKRSKFIHYHPRTVVINNIEYDHADIFDDIEAIKREFHRMIRIVPSQGQIVRHAEDIEIDSVLKQGSWSPVITFGGDKGQWQAESVEQDNSVFNVSFEGRQVAEVRWPLIGIHNVNNALAAIASARHVGVDPAQACAVLSDFKSVKRRLELRGCINGVSVYDDFAHHPTAIRLTLSAVRSKVGPTSRIFAVLEPRSNTMRMGIHKDTLGAALSSADQVLMYEPDKLNWDLSESLGILGDKCKVYTEIKQIIEDLANSAHANDHIVIMSNGGFQSIHEKLIQKLA